MSGTLTDYAEAKMWDLYKDHTDEVGSKYPGDKTGKKTTDCITYVRNVISHAYESMGQASLASDVWKYTEGIDLALFLKRLNWKAHYWNPDVRFPRDGQSEHPFSYQQAVKHGTYYKVKVDGFVVDYNLDFKKHPKGGFFAGCTPGGARNNDAIWNKISRVRFAYGLTRGGMHTFLYSMGMVFEVHWDKIGVDLYERSPFYKYEWLSGLLLTPPDAAFTSESRGGS